MAKKSISVKQLLTFVMITTNEKTFVGIPYSMTGEDHTDFSITILSKNGLLTFNQNDVTNVEVTTKEEFDLSVVDKTETGLPKTIRAKQIYLDNIGKMRRCDVIRLFCSELDMNEKGASTYFQNIKKSLK